jgi:hypothetical protein
MYVETCGLLSFVLLVKIFESHVDKHAGIWLLGTTERH